MQRALAHPTGALNLPPQVFCAACSVAGCGSHLIASSVQGLARFSGALSTFLLPMHERRAASMAVPTRGCSRLSLISHLPPRAVRCSGRMVLLKRLATLLRSLARDLERHGLYANLDARIRRDAGNQ